MSWPMVLVQFCELSRVVLEQSRNLPDRTQTFQKVGTFSHPSRYQTSVRSHWDEEQMEKDIHGPDHLWVMKKTHHLMGQGGLMILTKSHLQSSSLNNVMQFILGMTAHILKYLIQCFICIPALVWTFSTSGPNYPFILVLKVALDIARWKMTHK